MIEKELREEKYSVDGGRTFKEDKIDTARAQTVLDAIKDALYDLEGDMQAFVSRREHGFTPFGKLHRQYRSGGKNVQVILVPVAIVETGTPQPGRY